MGSDKNGINWGQTPIFLINDIDVVASNINLGSDPNIPTNNNIYVQVSNLNSAFNENTNIGGNTKLNAANDTTITNATIKEYHQTTKEVSNRRPLQITLIFPIISNNFFFFLAKKR